VDLGFLAARLKLRRRSAWTRFLPTAGKLRAAGGFNRVTLHHAGNTPLFLKAQDSVIRELDGVLTAHRQRRYGDIGYHFVVDYGGAVWEGRSLAYEGAHVLSANEHNVGVMLLGNFEEQKPSVDQVTAATWLVSLLRGRFRIPAHRVYGHRDLGQSVCPGRYVYDHVVRMRS